MGLVVVQLVDVFLLRVFERVVEGRGQHRIRGIDTMGLDEMQDLLVRGISGGVFVVHVFRRALQDRFVAS